MNPLHAKQITINIADKTICRDLNLNIQPGEIWGILGPNGSGKTTLLHTLAGLYSARCGEIFLGATQLRRLSVKVIAKSLGILFQDFNATFPQTVGEYCLAGRYPHLSYLQKESDEDKQIVADSLQKMELHHLTHRAITRLSGGEKRRLAIAALLVQTPHIYLLDEPTNHLDVRHQIHVLTHFRYLVETEARAVIMSLHDINLAQQFCNRILLLFGDGRTVQGTPEETLTAQHLTQLYQHSIEAIRNEKSTFWYPL